MLQVEKKWDVINCLFRLLVESPWSCVVGTHIWCRSKKKKESYYSTPLLSANTETGNDECQTQEKVISVVLHKILENNASPKKTSRTWFLVAMYRNVNELMTSERILDKYEHAS